MNVEIIERNKTSVRNYLNNLRLKLWLEPYSGEDGSKKASFEALAKDISTKLNISIPEVEEILEELRVHSCMKFKANAKFRESGIATLFLNVASSSEISISSAEGTMCVEMRLDSQGGSLKNEISKKLGMEPENLKLICLGQNIVDDLTLDRQNVKNLSNILVLFLSNEEKVNYKASEREHLIGQAKKAANLMTNNSYYNLELADQNGKPVDIALAEKKALSVAMMLHEKGRTCMKKKDYGLALVYLLEADAEFLHCHSELLEVVDNYALLSIDIVWCYYKLQQVSSLPDAERRLALCEEKLKKIYGPNMERVTKLRGGSYKELALVIRLHLMQAAIHFYRGTYNKSLDIIEKTEKELQTVSVDEKSMLAVMEMGFTETDARLALRFCNGNVEKAVEHIMAEKEKLKKIMEEERAKRAAKSVAHIKTSDGQSLDAELYKYLVSLGYKNKACLHALVTQNNNLSKALDLLEKGISIKLPTTSILPTTSHTDLNQQELSLITSLGISKESFINAVDTCNNPEEALTVLKDKLGVISGIAEQSIHSLLNSFYEGNDSENNQPEKDLVHSEMLDSINWSKDDYLNLTLDDEVSILQDFKGKLFSLGYGGHA